MKNFAQKKAAATAFDNKRSIVLQPNIAQVQRQLELLSHKFRLLGCCAESWIEARGGAA
jgi:hypothetical protein